MSLMGSCFNIQTNLSEVTQFLDSTYFNKNHQKYADQNFLQDIIIKFKKLRPADHLFLIKKIFEMELKVQNSNITEMENRFNFLDSLDTITLDIKLEFLQKIWESGNVKKYFNHAERIIDYCVAIKNFEKLKVILNATSTENSNWIKPHFAELILNLETKNLESAIATSDKIQDLLFNSWPKLVEKKISRIKYLEKLYATLWDFCSDEFVLTKHCLLLKLKLFHYTKLKDYLFSKEEILKYFIIFQNDHSLLSGLLPLLKNSVLAEEIKNIKKFNLLSIKNNFPLTYEKYKTNVRVKDQNANANDSGEIDLDLENPTCAQINLTEILEHYPIAISNDMSEDLILKQIEIDAFSESEKNEQLFYVFESMGFLEAAKNCLRDKDTRLDQLFLYCELLLRQNKYTECLFEIDSKIVSKQLNISLPIEFKYQKAEALRGLKKIDIATKIYSEILVENPDYRLVKERIKDA